MKKIIILLLLCVSFIGQLMAQDSLMNKNGIYIEILGNSPGYSINYERKILINNTRLVLRIGIGICQDNLNVNRPTIPIEGTLLLGKWTNCLETGLGFTSIYSPTSVPPLKNSDGQDTS